MKAPDGVELGTIVDLVITSHGDVDFAIVDQLEPSGIDGIFGLGTSWPSHLVPQNLKNEVPRTQGDFQC